MLSRTAPNFIDLELSANWEIDFGFKDFSDSLKEEGIKTVEQAIIHINQFWVDSPNEDDEFNEHLNYFLKYATVRIHYIYNNTTLWDVNDLTRHLFSKEEGFCVGKCGIELTDFYDGFELNDDLLEVHEQ
ncbi:hypothetical protein [Avibacterium endocarditidis]|uniref:hypothetical protein n=1 Tax=Avibacterium endocarditidis TaxID=380674 RepID=UPI0039EF03C7